MGKKWGEMEKMGKNRKKMKNNHGKKKIMERKNHGKNKIME